MSKPYLPPAVDFTEESASGDLYYTGDRLDDCLATVRQDRYIKTGKVGLTMRVEFTDDPEMEQGAEWGTGATLDEAFRYAVAAFFGPIDEGFAGEVEEES